MSLSRTAALCTSLFFVAACSGDSSPGVGGGICTFYLGCLKQIADQTGQSASYDQAVMLYGGSSGCGQSAATEQACEDACLNAIGILQQSGMCGGSGADASVPKGPIDLGHRCTPNCRGIACGNDGCGGSCGSCGSGRVCMQGTCITPCTPNCGGVQCGDDGCGGSCGTCGAQLMCQGGNCVPVPCDCQHGCCPNTPYRYVTVDPGATVGAPPIVNCTCAAACTPAAGGTINSCFQDSDCCSDAHCSQITGEPAGICVGGCWRNTCTASYGNGGCCISNKYCTGSSACFSCGLTCGDYPGSNGSFCADDAACDQGLKCFSGVCLSASCAGKQCGPDGSGGSCGTCPGIQTCNGSGQCVACVPACTGKMCGPDGCLGSCGNCPPMQTCDGNGQCVCTPSCLGKVCGDDGCGGSCGTCAPGWLCGAGSCSIDPNSCDPVSNMGCASPNQCVLLSSEKPTCGVTGTGGQGSACTTTADCQGGYGCFAGTCRKICLVSTGAGCSGGSACTGVGGWIFYGACM
jgi:hypothetical protein